LPFVVTALDVTIVPNQRFYFWTGNSKPKTAISDLQAKLRKLFDLAKVAGGHADRFRDTFATELLLAAVPLVRATWKLAGSERKGKRRVHSASAHAKLIEDI
jgi:hypothetical protein